MDAPLYSQDSFFTLSALGQVGLVCVTLCLAAAAVTSCFWLGRRLPLLARIANAVLHFWLFLWLAPQAYYAYYRTIIDGLPEQWVINRPHTPIELFALMTFTGDATLSAHGKGILGWALVLTAIRSRRVAAN